LVAPADVHRVLVDRWGVYTSANREKRAVLSHSQPRGVVISGGPERPVRREFNEAALDTKRRVHRLAGELVLRLRQEADAILEEARSTGDLTWDGFAAEWWRMVRRIVLGDSARDDNAITDMLARLRRDANWRLPQAQAETPP
jgi:hypothetical protein